MNFNELRAELKRKNMTIEKLAVKIAISRSAMLRKINGQTEFTLGEINRIRKVLNLDYQQFDRVFFNCEVS